MNNKSNEILKNNSEDNETKENQLTIAKNNVIDLSELDQEQIAQLKKQYTEGMIDLKKKAEEMQIEENTLNAALNDFVGYTHQAIQSGSSLTISHTHTTNKGKTEIVIGNTEKAAKGKISRLTPGEKDNTVWIVSIVAIIAALIAISLGVGMLT